MSLRVVVNQRHISQGIPGSSCACPIALALQDLRDEDICVFNDHVTIGADRYSLPVSAQTFIELFDDELGVDAFEFELEKR